MSLCCMLCCMGAPLNKGTQGICQMIQRKWLLLCLYLVMCGLIGMCFIQALSHHQVYICVGHTREPQTEETNPATVRCECVLCLPVTPPLFLLSPSSLPQLVYRKDKEEMLKHFTQVESLASSQSRKQQQLASSIGYQTAPHEQERMGGYQPPPPSSYNQPPQTSYNPPPMQAGE